MCSSNDKILVVLEGNMLGPNAGGLSMIELMASFRDSCTNSHVFLFLLSICAQCEHSSRETSLVVERCEVVRT